jgi:hypothetical protein
LEVQVQGSDNLGGRQAPGGSRTRFSPMCVFGTGKALCLQTGGLCRRTSGLGMDGKRCEVPDDGWDGGMKM